LQSFLITTFKANPSPNNNKVPISPYGNKIFKFKNIKCQSLKECAEVLASNWILSNALSIENEIMAERNKKELSSLRNKNNRLMVLDLDKIKSSEDLHEIINFFKIHNYACVLTESKSFNGIDNFNIKGFLVINYENTRDNINKHILYLKSKLEAYCKVDETVMNDVSYHAFTNKTNILYIKENEDNDFISIENIVTNNRPVKHSLVATSKVITKCIEIYTKMGYELISPKINENQSINWSHWSEKKSKGGFFMFVNHPFIMHHNDSSRTVSIWNTLKKTEEGKEYLKMLFKKQQEDNLLDTTAYNNILILNERYINVDSCTDIIEDFLESHNSVLKIKSAMGTGKSLVIDKIIEDTDERVLIISNRISVALDYSKKYNIKTYLDKDDIWVPGENLIVQYDSLYKYNLKNFDIIILDEFMSLLFQTRSELNKANKNFNLSKFYSVLKGSKKVVIADAFLNGYENFILDKKFMYYIRNDYRDNITHYNYKHREMFVSSLINVLKNKKEGESVSVSVMSTNALNAMERYLSELGFNVMSLTATTPELRKKKIYSLFNEDNAPWDVILYSPTLTVGVSNLNNIKHHFHYDTGNSADVISSLQMIKRSRKAVYLHTFLKETQKYNPITSEDLDILSNNDIVRYFDGKQNTLLIDVDIDGNFKLSDIGKFANKIEALYNILENNHSHAFKILLGEQFNFSTKDIIINDNTYNFNHMIKKYKQEELAYTIEIIEKYKDCNYSDEHIMELKTKTIDYTDEEKTALIINEVKTRIKKDISKDLLIELTETNIASSGKFLNELESLSIAMSNKYKIQRELSNLVSSNINSIQNKDILDFYNYLNSLNIDKLKKWYSKKEIKEIDNRIGYGSFKLFLKKIGYKNKDGRMELSENHIKFYQLINT